MSQVPPRWEPRPPDPGARYDPRPPLFPAPSSSVAPTTISSPGPGAVTSQTPRLATLGLVFGITGLTVSVVFMAACVVASQFSVALFTIFLGLSLLGVLGAVLALTLGLISRAQLRRAQLRRAGRPPGRATAGVILGILGILGPLIGLVLPFLVIFAFSLGRG
ncbi:MAG: hypothetical protein ACREQM_18325 [Candidatus Dormibacteraceae bacterium]